MRHVCLVVDFVPHEAAGYEIGCAKQTVVISKSIIRRPLVLSGFFILKKRRFFGFSQAPFNQTKLASQRRKSDVNGSPWHNEIVESFHGRFWDECLNRGQLWTLTEARVVVDDFRQKYNQVRKALLSAAASDKPIS